jgi:ABC-2 type transport system ATP-binding protein
MLQVVELTKRFGAREILHQVSFTIEPGEILGYLGPNGAGKSTTVKILTGLLEPSAGRLFFEGRRIHQDLVEYKRRIGYVPEEALLYPYLSGQEYLQLIGRLRGIPERMLKEKIDSFLSLFSLSASRQLTLSSYSKGMRQKVLISAALLHNPDILIFDEPLSGLDVTSALVAKNLIRALAREGKIILFCSHVLEVVEKICSRVIILHQGSIVANDSVERLRFLVQSASLEEAFSQLVLQENTERIAEDLVQAMKLPFGASQ